MEAVRPKKPRPKVEPLREAPPIPTHSRPAIVNGVRLPDVPLGEVHVAERSESPEPEEITIEPSPLPSAENSLEPPIEAEEESSSPTTAITEPMPHVEAPPVPARSLIFPRMPQVSSNEAQEVATPPIPPRRTTRQESEAQPAPVSAYPTVPKMEEFDIAIPKLNTRIAPAPPAYGLVEDAAPSSIEKVPILPAYPVISKLVFEKNEYGLMTEEQLLTYYHNPLYETTDDFVDKFVEHEEIPSGSRPLFGLLKRLKELCEDLELSIASEKNCTDRMQKVMSKLWVAESKQQAYKGRCGENKESTGYVQYTTHAYSEAVGNDLRNDLRLNRSLIMDKRLSCEAQIRSLCLQIQWQVIAINNQFMTEHGLTIQSSPCLIEAAIPSDGRQLLLLALSDLFHHLRVPTLPKQFSDSVIAWITELCCALHMSCRVVDSQFLLNHILRLPSPISSWAAPLIQAFIQANSAAKLKVDYCITMLSHLMNPIKAREAFLRQVGQSEAEDAGWAILSDDTDEPEEFSFVTISEADLVALLEQLPISDFYPVALLHFSQTGIGDRTSQFLSVLAFQLLLMKVLEDGLSTYAKPGYKQFCKQIGNYIRQSVRELCFYWRDTRSFLAGPDEGHIQKEVDRVLMLALQYVIHRDSAGLWQFLVDLPFDCVSEECRLRSEYMLRSSSKLPLSDVFLVPMPEIIARNKQGGLKERANALGPLDAVFLVNALSSLVSYSTNDASSFIKELIEVCYCDETCRESLYKVGAEGVATLLGRRKELFDTLIAILDRNIDHMDSYAVDVLSSSNLTTCKISPTVLEILGKWLVNKSPDQAANRLARRILSSLHWGYAERNELWNALRVHEICADSVLKAHIKHCTNSNGMIAKSIKQISKLAGKMADHEQLFSQFCWDIMIKLKLPEVSSSEKPPNDLVAFYLAINRNYMESLTTFLEKGVSLLNDLVASGSAAACVVLLSNVMKNHYDHVDALGLSKDFVAVFDRIIHVDQCSYAVQWLSGPSSTPTPNVRLICSAISYHSRSVNDSAKYLRAWVELLCVKGQDTWNSDQVILQILGTITRIAFVHDHKNMYGLREIISHVYTKILVTWKETSKGFFSFLSAEPTPPPLIAPAYYSVSPFATYLLLMVECSAFSTYYQHLYETFVKKSKTTLESAVKKASSKCSMSIPVDSLGVYCWAKFVNGCKDSYVYPLALQQLATNAYKLRTVNGRKHQFCRQFVDASTGEPIMSELKKTLQDATDDRGLSRAVNGWLFTSADVTRSGFDFSKFDLDFLLQLILADDENVWIDFVDVSKMQREDDTEAKLFSMSCHLHVIDLTSGLVHGHSQRQRVSHALPFPCLPAHPVLPPAPVVDSSAIFQQHSLTDTARKLVSAISNLAQEFVVGADKLEELDSEYCDLLLKLYTPLSKNLPIEFKCNAKCPASNHQHVTVSINEFNTQTDACMSRNRENRKSRWVEQCAAIIDKTALHTAGLEHLARQVSRLASMCTGQHRGGAQMTGRALFYLLTSSISDTALMYPAALDTFDHALRTLSNEFVRFRPEEQIPVMRLVLDGFVLFDSLVESFTPECLSSTDLCDAYSKLSEAVRDPERSHRALKLLSRLGIDKAAVSLPPQQFAPLLPLAFKNLASQPDPASPLHLLCMQHVITFVFHAFPANFAAGLDLALDGCGSGVTPPTLLSAFVVKIGADHFEMPKALFSLPPDKCKECLLLLTRRLTDGRSRTPAFYAVWGRYLSDITRLAQLFVFTPVRLSFHSETPTAILEKDLAEIFHGTTAVWNPLIAPPSSSIPPFSVSNDEEAKLVVDRLVELFLTIPHGSVVPSAFRNLPSLLWQYYFEKLSILTHGSAHFFDIIETAFMRIQWGTLWPSHRALQAMDECLASRSRDCASFVAQMAVRVQWKEVLQSHVPADLLPQYLQVLCSLLARISSNSSSYSKIAASFLSLLKSLSLRSDWQLVTPDAVDILAPNIALVLPHNALSSPSEAVAVFQIIWRKVCCFSPKEPFTASSLLKQTLWVRTECKLLVRGGISKAVPSYNSIISDVNAVASTHTNLRAFCAVARELIVLWTHISDQKFGEDVVMAWNNYLAANVESPLVLTCLNTITGSLKDDQLSMALKVLEKTLKSYFMRANKSWEEVMKWIQLPSNVHSVQSFLLNPPSSTSPPLFLVMKVFLDYGNHSEDVFRKLVDYIVSIKPKHITCEASFALVLHRLFIWISHHSAKLPATFAVCDDVLPPLIRWMAKAAKDDSSFITNLITSKKTAHGPKLRALLGIMELYLTQQSLGEGKRPRCDNTTAVMNTRINAVKDLSSQKAFSPFISTFSIALPYFSQPDLHHIGSAPQLCMRAAFSLFHEPFLTDS